MRKDRPDAVRDRMGWPRWLMLLLLLGIWGNLLAQNRPVTSTVQLTPPYSVYLADYARPGSEQMKVYLLLRDLGEVAYDVRLRLTIEGAGIRLQTDPSFLPPPLTLEGGSPTIVSGEDLAPYLDSRNLIFSGITQAEYEQRRALPEGFYQFSVEVLDYRRGDRVLSRAATFTAWFTLNEPPRLTAPLCGTTLPLQEPMNLLFQWAGGGNINPGNPFSTEYELTLVEVFPADRPVEDAIRSSVPLLQTITTETSYLYGITEAALIPGQKYAFRVRALDSEGRAMYKNEGYSETCSFTYGDGVALTPPDGIRVYADNARRATVNWHLSLEPDRYRVEYRRRGDEGEEELAWFSEETSEEQVVLRDLEPATTYEVRVASLFGGYVSRYSAMQTFTTPKVMVAACGAAPAPVISASTLPLTTALAGQYWQVGNFEMQVRDVRGGDGVYTGWGVMSVPYLGLQIPVKFDRVWVDEDYQVARGEVVALSEGIEGFRERWQEEHPQGEEAGEEKSSQEDEPVAEGSNENGASPDAPVASVVVAGEVREVYLNEQGQVVAVDSQGNEEVVAEEVPEEGEVLALEDSEGNSFTVGSDGGVSNGGASANGSDASAAAHALEKRLLAELLQDFDQKIVVWLENHEKGPLDEQTIRLLQELPSCVPPGSEEVVEIHQFIERLEDNLEEAWNSLSQATQQWFSEVVESLSPEQNSLAEQLSEEDQQAGEQIVCEMVVVNNDDFVLELLLGENTLQEAGVTMLVSAAPQMPDIRARVTKAGDSDVEVEMRLRIEYARSCPDAASRSRNDITYFPATGWHKINTNELWDIDFGHDNSVGIQRPMIRGGRATLMFKYGEEQEGSIEFMIKGENPTVQQVMSVLEQAPYNTIWFMKKVALHESATNNPTDNTARAQQFNYENDCCEGLDEDWDAWSRCPNQGAPCGWGLMQMDLPAPTIQAMWDWRANIHQAYNLLIGEKRQSVISHMRRSMNTINEWNFQHADNPVQGHADRDEGGIIYTHSSSDQFQNTGITNFDDHFVDGPDGDDRSFLDACWIKTYNGLGTERLHFYFVTQEGNNRPEWNISNTATYGNSVNYYVEDISEQNTP